MKPSGIGGQAVIEGIMMRNKEKYSIAVRKPDKEIEVVVKEGKLLTEKYKWLNYPIIRGIFNFADSLVTGIKTINYSASFYDDPAEQETTKADEIGKTIFKDKFEAVLMAITIIISVAFAVGLFMLLPYYISRLLKNYIASKLLLNFIEGIVRVVIFIAYLLLISKMNDIKRTFMYHGAEHKCINCVENGIILTPENVQKCSRFHKRCGTSFLFFVMFVSIIFFIFIRVDNTALQIIIRILLIPVIAGVSYELIRWAGKSENKFVNALSKPGLLMQHLTTKEPDLDMIEVAIQAVEAVFDWKAFIIEYYKDSENPFEALQNKEEELKISSDLLNNKEKTRTIIPDVVEADSRDNVDVTSAESQYLENRIDEEVDYKSVYEESDDSESTIHDNVSDDDFNNSNDGIVASDTENDDELPEGFEILEDDDTYDNAIRTRQDILDRNQNSFSYNTLDDDKDKNADSSNKSDNGYNADEDGIKTAISDDITEDSKADTDEDISDNNSDDGIVFEEEMEEEELTGDELPLFKVHDEE